MTNVYRSSAQANRSLTASWCATWLILISVLTGCGGGSTQNETPPVLSKAEYLGTWYPIAPTCESNFFYNPALYVGGTQLEVTTDTLKTTVTTYSDSVCQKPVGTLTRTYVLTASLGSVTGKDNVAKWAINLLNNAFTTTIPTLTKTPGLLTEPEYLDLADVQAGLLYRGDQSSPKDVMGFPTRLQNSAAYTRTAPNNNNNNNNGGANAPVDTSVKITAASVNGVNVDLTQPIVAKNGDDIRITTDKITTFEVTSFLNGQPIATTVQWLDNAKGINTNTWHGAVLSQPGSNLQVSYINSATNTFVPFSALNIRVESAYQGTWNATYSGGDSGACSGLAVNATGIITGTCSSASLATAQSVTGNIDARGGANFANGTASTGATFIGTFGQQTASGTWTNPTYGVGGTWVATKR
jgi:hypothetical protein